MRPISIKDAQRMAMSSGGKIDFSGKQFNASRSISNISAKPVEKSEPQASPAQAIKPDEGALSSAAIEKLAAATFTLADQNASVIHAIQKKLESAPAPINPVRHWTFKVNRDAAGNMTTIDAIAKE